METPKGVTYPSKRRRRVIFVDNKFYGTINSAGVKSYGNSQRSYLSVKTP
jgi:hypothetical protein